MEMAFRVTIGLAGSWLVSNCDNLALDAKEPINTWIAKSR